MREAVLKIIMPDNWVKNISSKYTANIKFIYCMPYGETGGRGLVEIMGDEDEINKVLAEIRIHPDVCSVDISAHKEGCILASIITDKCSACRALASSDCFLISAHCIGDESVEWRLITGGESSLSDLIEDLKHRGCKVELTNSNELTKKKILTTREEEIISLALKKGYYDYPQKITIKELGEMFDVSPSTIGETLQRGKKKIMREYFHSRV